MKSFAYTLLASSVLFACGDSDDGVMFQGGAGTAGTGGTKATGKGGETGEGGSTPAPEGGSGGSAGKGGSGKGGTTGKGGDAGKGGTAGKGGSSGAGGKGGTTGKAGAAGGPSGGVGGNGGESGEGGSDPGGNAGNGGEAGAGGSQGGAAGSNDTAGAGGSSDPGPCTPGTTVACYGGPAGTLGVGACKAGTAVCGADGVVGACDGEVLPALDACDAVDRDCDGSWTARVPSICPTIQAAIDVVASAQVSAKVLVAAGEYAENIDFKGARAHVVGEGGRSGTTIIGVAKDKPVVRLASGETDESVLEGFTVRGGFGEKKDKAIWGGGIYVKGGSPKLLSLDVRDNETQGDLGYGAGMALDATNALVQDVRFYDNASGYYGGGLHVGQGAPRLHRLSFTDNESVWGGGATLYFSKAIMTQTVFARNDASRAGAVFIQGGSPRVENVAMLEDFADDGGAIRITSASTTTLRNVTIGSGDANDVAIVVEESPKVVLSFVNLWLDGKTLTVKGVSPSPTVLRVDPQFVSEQGNTLAWDLHLAPGSKLIDAGDPGLKDADGTRSDIGAYGGPANP